MDIGQPKDFIIGTGLYLEHLKTSQPDKLASGDSFVGNVLVVSPTRIYVHGMIKLTRVCFSALVFQGTFPGLMLPIVAPK